MTNNSAQDDTTDSPHHRHAIHSDFLEELILRKNKGLSPIWVIPVLAIAIGVWYLYDKNSVVETTITIEFETGAGIEVDSSKIVYRGITVGRVVSMQAKDDLSGVVVTAVINSGSEHLLAGNTQFWLVSPQISLKGISGIETLLSGAYIEMSPDAAAVASKQKMRTSFVALNDVPPKSLASPGVNLSLKAEELGSVSIGSELYFRKIPIGLVEDVRLNDDGKGVVIQVFIEQEYAHLINSKTRFWNAGGVSVEGSLAGLKVRTESLASIISGGIALATPEDDMEATPVNDGDEFVLYSSFDLAQVGVQGVITLANGKGLTEGVSKIVYQGVKVGTIQTLTLTGDLKQVEAQVLFDPAVEHLLKANTLFWKVEPNISLQGVSDLETAIFGSYIAMSPQGSSSKAARSWVAKAKKPRQDHNADGFYLHLSATELGSLNYGSGVYYKKIKMGEVVDYRINQQSSLAAKDAIELVVFLKPEAKKLINSSSRFWHASGTSLKASLAQGVEFRTESLLSLLNGGIVFSTPDPSARGIKNRAEFLLYEDFDSAHEQGELITVVFSKPHGLQVGASLKYLDITLGEVKSIKWTNGLSNVEVSVLLYPEGADIAREGSIFWVAKPQIGIVRSSNLDTVVFGEFIKVKPGAGIKARVFKGLDHAPNSNLEDLTTGVNVIVKAKRIGTVVRGDPVYYRELEVGKVTGFDLSEDASAVHILVNVQQPYDDLVRTNSVFWNVGGVSGDLGWGGFEFQTRTFAAMLDGGLSFITPTNPGPKIQDGHVFDLHDKEGEGWMDWNPGIRLKQNPKGFSNKETLYDLINR